MKSAITTAKTFVLNEFPPVAWRVWWRYHDRLLTTVKPSKAEFRDFKTESEAETFKLTLLRTYPHSPVCLTPRYLPAPKRSAKLDARQHHIAGDWPLQCRPLDDPSRTQPEIPTGQEPANECVLNSDQDKSQ
jgi:hypothetical protein